MTIEIIRKVRHSKKLALKLERASPLAVILSNWNVLVRGCVIGAEPQKKRPFRANGPSLGRKRPIWAMKRD